MNARQFQQLESTFRWASGVASCIGVIHLEPRELTRRVGLTFTDGRDDLDHFQATALELTSGRCFVLVSRPPQGYGIDVYVEAGTESSGALQELAVALNLAPGEAA